MAKNSKSTADPLDAAATAHPDSMVRVARFNRRVTWLRLLVNLTGGAFLYYFVGPQIALAWLAAALFIGTASTLVRDRLIAGDLRFRRPHLFFVSAQVLSWVVLAALLWQVGTETPRIGAVVALLSTALIGVTRGHKDRRILFVMTAPALIALSALMAMYFLETVSFWTAITGALATASGCVLTYASAYALYRGDRALHIANAARDRLTADLAASNRFLEDVSEVSGIGGWQVDVATTRMVWTPLVFKIHELETSEVLDLEVGINFYAPEARERVRRAVTAGLSHGTPWTFEEPFITAKGRRIWVRVAGKPFYENGVLTKLVGSFQDITEHVEIQQRLRRAEILQAVGQLSGGIAHDFNNLLTAIVSATEVLDGDAATDPRSAHAVDTIKTAAQRAGDLTQSLLAYSRQQVLAPRHVSLNGIVAETVRLVRPMIPADIDLKIELDVRAPHALLDSTQLSAAILNLILNARDAMPGGGALTVRTRAGDRAGVEVSDTGVGIAPEALPHIFDPFFTTKSVGRGSGLGLSMVQGFVEQSGGRVMVRSEPGAGATFALEFPIVGAAAPAPPARPQPPARTIPGGILLVEDDELVRDALSIALESAGYTVIATSDGPSALAMVEAGATFDLLISDVVMKGGISGPQLVEEILSRRPSVKALLVSGYPRESLSELGKLPAGMAFAAKPFDLAELQRKIAELLGKSPPAPPSHKES
ncbi:MAG: multi-sensor hybrid histidine kinase [Alphaproteobacteria bacterium]|nr:MAG: multi-sensor hybrid histidine kinase [Caulobacteraceae bacterium]TPW08706.1 MAG: multi-sensor hybrid histidine kinase [Alphaproteobacteria bacterium]